eukprot:TRINITY_DN17833_c1_g1_i2.p1 TRINITY_DN17833_c1_g1~~TRINITY_DN17833_c1_g1_i2.p1  ORF type:complete len:219 (+),score=5.48 TRINITY_DN17833_c1_g1_i2:85-741(+)
MRGPRAGASGALEVYVPPSEREDGAHRGPRVVGRTEGSASCTIPITPRPVAPTPQPADRTSAPPTYAPDVDECIIYEDICTEAGQTCVDPEPGLVGHWKCMCPPPNERVGRTEGPATCPTSAPPTDAPDVDECIIYGHICTDAGQTCVDPEPGLVGHWKCMCPPPNERVGRTGGPRVMHHPDHTAPGRSDTPACRSHISTTHIGPRDVPHISTTHRRT